MPRLATITECTGCSACENSCTRNAIRMVADKEGFLQPHIDSTMCVDCGLCEKSCPIVTPQENSNTTEPTTYAFWHNEDRTKSSSGGAFSAFARKVLAEGGVVYGAAYSPFPIVRHIAVSTIEDLDRLRGSKYLQSTIGDAYQKIRQELQNGVKVLFTGTPCQVAGLRSYLHKEYKNLLLVDIACHGTPSAKVFAAYLKKLQNNIGTATDGNIRHLEFRNRKGWGFAPSVMVGEHNRSLHGIDNLYMKAFDKAAIFRKSCYQCPFARIPRAGDCTIADFWGIGRFGDRFSHDVMSGVSLVLVNNDHGAEAFNRLDDCFSEKRQLDEALHLNHNLVGPSELHPQRDEIVQAFLDESQTLDSIEQAFRIVPHSLKALVSEWSLRLGLYDFVKRFYNRIR